VLPAPHAGSLRVDHIVPLALGGGNDDANLRTLCLLHHQAVSARGGG
jgi:5-methylcytosine-specific restriction endonuclease McrA